MRILLSAYFDHNLGDDLFVDYFAQRYRNHEIQLLCDAEMQLNPQIENRSLKKIGLKRAIKALYKFDALAIVGGSIFQENPNCYKYDYRRNALVTLFRLLGRKVFIVGCNIGPVHSRRGKRIFKYCFFLANAISVRDSASFALLQQWRCRKNYLLAPDLVSSYPYTPQKIPRSGRRLGISVINLGRPAAETAAYIGKLRELVAAYLERDALHEVWLFGFDGGNESDGAAMERIVQSLPLHAGRIRQWQYSPQHPIHEFLDRFSSCDYMVCSRFHSVVLALKYEIPFFPIAYSDKTLNMLSDIKYDGRLARYAAMNELDIGLVLSDIAAQRRFTIDASLIDASRYHFIAVDRLVSAR